VYYCNITLRSKVLLCNYIWYFSIKPYWSRLYYKAAVSLQPCVGCRSD
jgi:hypothetical protein